MQLNKDKMTLKLATSVIYFLAATLSFNSFAREGLLAYEKFYRLNNPAGQVDANDWAGLSYKDGFKINWWSEVSLENNTSSTSGVERTLKGAWVGELDLDLRYYRVTKDLNYSVPELFIGYQSSDSKRHNGWFGRKLLNWSMSEDYWNLGHLNASQSFTLLGQKKEGLLGLHYNNRWREVRYDFFFSYLFIPQLNPDVSIKFGEIVSNSEWVKKPPTETEILGQTRPIFYELNKPKTSDIVFKRSLGARVSFPLLYGHFSIFGVYKPENRIRINADAKYDLDREKVVVTASPIVNHHLFYGIEFRQKLGDVVAAIGMDVTDPNARLGDDFEVLNPLQLEDEDRIFNTKYFKIEPNYDRESYGHFSLRLDKPFYFITANYIHLLSSNNRGSDDFYSETVKWKRAIGILVNYALIDDLSLEVDLKYDLEREDNILRANIGYRIIRNLSIKCGFELMNAPDRNSYWSAYRANDTVYTSLAYHF